MSGHVLRLGMDPWSVRVDIDCYEPPGSSCRMDCPEGCPDWGDDHPHQLQDGGRCLAVEWMDPVSDYLDPEAGAIVPRDAMPVEVAWEYDHWTWRPARPDPFVMFVVHGAGTDLPTAELWVHHLSDEAALSVVTDGLSALLERVGLPMPTNGKIDNVRWEDGTTESGGSS